MTIDITVRNPHLLRLIEALEGSQRIGLSEAMGHGVQDVTEKHLLSLAGSRHTTADRLGGRYTGFLSAAADQVSQAGALSADSTSATLTISHPGFGRAFHGVTILPKKEFIPIPLNALAYGHSPLEFQGQPILFLRQRGSGSPAKKAKAKPQAPIPTNIPAWLLVRSVTQPQDRTLLPTEAEWRAGAASEAERFLSKLA